jgi:hypothetical protein
VGVGDWLRLGLGKDEAVFRESEIDPEVLPELTVADLEKLGVPLSQADPNADALVKAVAGDFETSEGRGLAQDGVKAAIAGSTTPPDIVAKALDSLKAVSGLLDRKAGADAVPFKTWLVGVAKAVSEAAPEGGFLGFGGTHVSEAEKATVAQIAAGLGLPAPAA